MQRQMRRYADPNSRYPHVSSPDHIFQSPTGCDKDALEIGDSRADLDCTRCFMAEMTCVDP